MNSTTFPEIGIRLPRLLSMGTKPATRLDTWAQWLGIIATIITLGLLLLNSSKDNEHRMTMVEANTGQMAKSAASSDATSREAYEISRLSARGILIVLEVVRKLPAAKGKQPDILDVMEKLKAKKVSENDMPDFAGGGGGARMPGVSNE